MTDTTTTTADKDPRLVEAEIELAAANARKAAAEARTAEVDSLVPAIPKEVTGGKVTVPDTPGRLATLAVYRALGRVGMEIAEKVPPAGCLWIVPDGTVLAAAQTRGAVQARVARLAELADVMATRLSAGLPTPVEPVPTTVPVPEPTVSKPAVPEPTVPKPTVELRSGGTSAALETALGLIPLVTSMVSTPRIVRSADVSVEFEAAAAAVMAGLANRPESQDVHVWGISEPPQAAPDTGLAALRTARARLSAALVAAAGASAATRAEVVAAATVDAWTAVLGEVVKKDVEQAKGIVDAMAEAAGDVAGLRAGRAVLGEEVTSGRQLLAVIDDLLPKIDPAEQALAGAGAQIVLPDGCHALVLRPLFAGAEAIYEDKLVRDRGLHIGSSVVAWFVLDQDRRVLTSGVTSRTATASTKVGLSEVSWDGGTHQAER